jgi:amino acid transporter
MQSLLMCNKCWMSRKLTTWPLLEMLDAIYPVLFLDYVFQLWTSAADDEVSPFVRFMLLSSTSILLGYLNWLGLHIVGNMSIVIGIISMSPFLIMVLIGTFKLDTSRWLEIPSSNDGGGEPAQGLWSALLSGAILWRPLLNNLFWNLNSFDSTASYAAEVRDPGYVLPRSLGLGVVFMMAGYMLPMLVAIGATDSEPEDWVDGYLTTAAEEIGGEWLGAWVVVAAGVSNIALFQAELSADAFQLMGMAERGFVPKIFATRSRHGTPTYGVMMGVLVIIAMGSFDLEELIEMLNFNYAISLILEYAAFMKLRISKPDGMLTNVLMGQPIHRVHFDFLTHLISWLICFQILVSLLLGSSQTISNSPGHSWLFHFLAPARCRYCDYHGFGKSDDTSLQRGHQLVWDSDILFLQRIAVLHRML